MWPHMRAEEQKSFWWWILGQKDNKDVRRTERFSLFAVTEHRRALQFPLSSLLAPASFLHFSFLLFNQLTLFCTFCVFTPPPPTCATVEAHYFTLSSVLARTHAHNISYSPTLSPTSYFLAQVLHHPLADWQLCVFTRVPVWLTGAPQADGHGGEGGIYVLFFHYLIATHAIKPEGLPRKLTSALVVYGCLLL